VGIVLAQTYKIIENNDKYITVEINFNNKFSYSDTTIGSVKFTKIIGQTPYNRIEGEPLIPEMYLSFGIPFVSKPTVEINKIERK